MTCILGLDPSLSSAGFALWRPGWELPVYGHWKLAESAKFAARGGVRLQRNLIELHKEHGPIEVMAVEQAIPGHMMHGKTNAKTVKALAYIEAAALMFAEAVGARWQLVPVGSWRNTFLGSMRKASRLDHKTLAQVCARDLGMSTAAHDEAEAIGLLDYQMHLEGITPPWRVATPLIAVG